MLTTLTARPTLQTLHEDQLEPLVRRTLEGEPQAWRELWCAVDPTIEALAGRFRAGGRLAARDDERRNVVVRVMERLREGGFARLRTFHTVLLRRDGSFRAWLAVVTRRSALNNARDHAENLGASADSAHRRWVELLPLPEAIEDALPVSTRAAQTAEAVRIETYIEQHIPPAHRQALRLWLLGHSHTEIAEALRLARPVDADLLVRTTLMHLRRHFSQP